MMADCSSCVRWPHLSQSGARPGEWLPNLIMALASLDHLMTGQFNCTCAAARVTRWGRRRFIASARPGAPAEAITIGQLGALGQPIELGS